eukprot:TRINITY_DN25763_c0_g1_i1.p3 TRINITY_DN25763_c0_g1~~TRINITY_DN25763_c0_g1_i1.p3  ORF type:complete len:134 (-),score=53.81 TRINITY_DN25763_c0_g1_i1:292-693(-)
MGCAAQEGEEHGEEVVVEVEYCEDCPMCNPDGFVRKPKDAASTPRKHEHPAEPENELLESQEVPMEAHEEVEHEDVVVVEEEEDAEKQAAAVSLKQELESADAAADSESEDEDEDASTDDGNDIEEEDDGDAA